MEGGIKILNEDCLEVLRRLPDNSIDLILQDPPYNTTNCIWEYELNLPLLWPEWLRVLKPTGIIAIFCNEPFTSKLIMSNIEMFRYKWIWDKDSASGFLNAYKMPLTGYEEVVIFSPAKMGNHTYNPQFSAKAKNLQRPPNTNGKINNGTYSDFKNLSKNMDREKAFPKNIIRIAKNEAECNSINRIHETQKPIPLMRYFIKTYSNKGDTVFDGYSGSGTTAAACHIEGRNAICCENDTTEGYFQKSVKRLSDLQSQQQLFQ